MRPASMLLLLVLGAAGAARAEDAPWRFKIDGRLGLGVGTQLGSELHRSFALEAGLTGRLALGTAYEDLPATILMPEISYTGLYSGELRTTHGMALGLGLGRLDDGLVYGLVPGLVYAVIGPSGARDSGYGARLLATFEWYHALGLQVGYQAVSFPGEVVQEVRVTASVNAAIILVVLAIIGH